MKETPLWCIVFWKLQQHEDILGKELLVDILREIKEHTLFGSKIASDLENPESVPYVLDALNHFFSTDSEFDDEFDIFALYYVFSVNNRIPFDYVLIGHPEAGVGPSLDEDLLWETIFEEYLPFTTTGEREFIKLDENIGFMTEILKLISENHDKIPAVHSTIKIWKNLQSGDNLWNLNFTGLSENGILLENSISQVLVDLGVVDPSLNLSGDSWYQIFMKDAGDDDPSHLKAVKSIFDSITKGYELMVEMKNEIVDFISNNVSIFPASGEWGTMMAVLKPMLIELGIDIGTDFIPGVGEIKAFFNAKAAIENMNYGEAAMEIIGGLAGLLPIGDLIKAGAKTGDALFKGFKIFRTLKALAKISSEILTNVKNFTISGWAFRLTDDKLKVFDNIGENVADILDETDDLVAGIVVKKPNGKRLLLTNSINNLNPIDISSDGAQSLVRSSNPANHMRFKTQETEWVDDVNDIIANGDISGESTETLMRNYLEQDNWEHRTGGKYGSNNGFDNIFENPETGQILFDESKQYAPRLSGATQTNPKQMSEEWVRKVAKKIGETDPDFEMEIIEALDDGKLIRTVSSVIRTGQNAGTIVTIRVGG